MHYAYLRMTVLLRNPFIWIRMMRIRTDARQIRACLFTSRTLYITKKDKVLWIASIIFTLSKKLFSYQECYPREEMGTFHTSKPSQHIISFTFNSNFKFVSLFKSLHFDFKVKLVNWHKYYETQKKTKTSQF